MAEIVKKSIRAVVLVAVLGATVAFMVSIVGFLYTLVLWLFAVIFTVLAVVVMWAFDDEDGESCTKQ